MKEIIVLTNDAGQRADKFFLKTFPLLPSSLLYKYLRIKRIKRNGKRCNAADKLQAGDRLQLYIEDDLLTQPQDKTAFLSAPTELDIVYEDSNLLLVNKKPGLLVHEDENEQIDTLIHRICHYLHQKGEFDPQRENSFVPALCNRIDRNTGGIVIAAKNAEALRIMNQKIKDRELQKLYLCVVHGALQKKSSTLKGYLTKDEKNNLVTVYPRQVPGSKTILTKYRVLQQKDGYSLVEVDLLTGRTHQIRAHFASIGHPLAGDTKYGLSRENRENGCKFQQLCAYKLTFHFTTDAGMLNYLDGKSFQVNEVAFLSRFGFEPIF